MDLSLLALGHLGGDSQSLESGKRTLSSSACNSDVAVPMRNTVEVMDYRLERSGVGSDRGGRILGVTWDGLGSWTGRVRDALLKLAGETDGGGRGVVSILVLYAWHQPEFVGCRLPNEELPGGQ